MTIHFTKIRRFTVPKGVFDFSKFTHIVGLRKLFNCKQKIMYSLIAEEGFPTPVFIGKRNYWNIDSVEKYLKHRVRKC